MFFRLLTKYLGFQIIQDKLKLMNSNACTLICGWALWIMCPETWNWMSNATVIAALGLSNLQNGMLVYREGLGLLFFDGAQPLGEIRLFVFEGLDFHQSPNTIHESLPLLGGDWGVGQPDEKIYNYTPDLVPFAKKPFAQHDYGWIFLMAAN